MATLKDIARETGVSRQTVARVLSGNAKEVWPSMAERAERIRRVAQEIGYRPHAAARATVTGKFHTLGLLLSVEHNRNILSQNLLDGVFEACHEHDQHLAIARLPDHRLTSPASVPKLLRELNCDGLLIDYCSRIPGSMLDLLKEYSVPSVWVNSKQSADCVHPDDLAAGYQATVALFENGHREIGYLDMGPHWHYSNLDRHLGYQAAMRDFGLRPRSFYELVTGRERLQHCADILGCHYPEATAMVAYSNVACLAMGALQAGRQPGLDLALVTLSNEDQHSYPHLAARQPVPDYQMGRRAVEMLLAKIADPDRELPPVVVPPRRIKEEIPAPARRQAAES